MTGRTGARLRPQRKRRPSRTVQQCRGPVHKAAAGVAAPKSRGSAPQRIQHLRSCASYVLGPAIFCLWHAGRLFHDLGVRPATARSCKYTAPSDRLTEEVRPQLHRDESHYCTMSYHENVHMRGHDQKTVKSRLKKPQWHYSALLCAAKCH